MQTNKKIIEELVFTALGEASMCWTPLPSSQVFDSAKAKEIGDRLVKDLLFPSIGEKAFTCLTCNRVADKCICFDVEKDLTGDKSAEEWLKERYKVNFYNNETAYGFKWTDLMEEYAQQQCSLRDKEIAELKEEVTVWKSMYEKLNLNNK
jgi:hypothetical protein